MEKSDGSEYLPTGPIRTRVERNKVSADTDKTYHYEQVNPGHPFDISGPRDNGYKFRLTVDDLEPKPVPFTPEGRRIFERTGPWHDDVLRCMPLGLPRTFGSPHAMEMGTASRCIRPGRVCTPCIRPHFSEVINIRAVSR